MTYPNIKKATFIARPNRFIAHVELCGKTEICHVKNTGRCKELLLPGATVFINRSDRANRVTKYDLIAVYKGERLINMDSQAPNKAFLEYLHSGKYISGITHIRSEARYGGSRFDFYVEAENRKIFIEVKGVTLEENGAALFPDAPTMRGVKHLSELAASVSEGYEAHAVFVIQMQDVKYFTPNYKTHAAFGEALTAAAAAGVKAVALDCHVEPDSMGIREFVEVRY